MTAVESYMIDHDAQSDCSEIERCRALWQAVLQAAVDDMKGAATYKKSGEYKADVMEACEYIFSGLADERVEFSGLAADWVRSSVLRRSVAGEDGWRKTRRVIAAYSDAGGLFAPDCIKALVGFRAFMRASEKRKPFLRKSSH